MIFSHVTLYVDLRNEEIIVSKQFVHELQGQMYRIRRFTDQPNSEMLERQMRYQSIVLYE